MNVILSCGMISPAVCEKLSDIHIGKHKTSCYFVTHVTFISCILNFMKIRMTKSIPNEIKICKSNEIQKSDESKFSLWTMDRRTHMVTNILNLDCSVEFKDMPIGTLQRKFLSLII